MHTTQIPDDNEQSVDDSTAFDEPSSTQPLNPSHVHACASVSIQSKPISINLGNTNNNFNNNKESYEMETPEKKESSTFMDKNTRRLLMMIFMVLGYCFAEIIVGYKTGSLALIADSFHMLSDSLSLVVALYGIKLTGKGAHQTWTGIYNTYGWGRSQILTTLINAVFLIALCVTITLDAIERIMEPEQVHNPELVFWVGLGGLIVNILGLVLFGGHAHGHSHGGGGGDSAHGHGHSHETTHSHSHGSIKEEAENELDEVECSRQNISHSHSAGSEGHSHENMNLYAVYLHIFGDFLGSIVVMCTSGALVWLGQGRASSNLSGYAADLNSTGLWFNDVEMAYYPAVYDGSEAGPFGNTPDRDSLDCMQISDLLAYEKDAVKTDSNSIFGCYGVFNNTMGVQEIYYVEPSWTTWIDPVCSLILVVIVICLTYPVVRMPMLILMQTLPDSIDQKQLKADILDIPQVLAIHCLHVWQLDESKIVGSTHVVVKDINLWPNTLANVERIFRNMGITSMTIQPEVLTRTYTNSMSVGHHQMGLSAIDEEKYRVARSMQKCATKGKNEEEDQCCSTSQLVKK